VPSQVPANSKLQILETERLKQIPWLIHGFSTRRGGYSRAYGGHSLNLGFTKTDTKAAVERNRAAFLANLGANGHRPWTLVTMGQIHSDVIHAISKLDEPLVGDGMITNVPGLILAVQTADCLPVVLVDPKNCAVGVFHAGWRGTVKRIVEKGVGAMRLHFGSRARDLEAAIGPGVRNCCYTVGEEVRDKFHSQFAYAHKLFHEIKESDPVREKYPMLFLTARAPGHSTLPVNIFLDLVEANRLQLIDAGVSAKRIQPLQFCTACNTDLLFSHRAEKGIAGRMMGVAGIRPKTAARRGER
jgi:purine-nucleoside/S-methyl-5'-thioadenosine phosphorylase / adenosine deaminase